MQDGKCSLVGFFNSKVKHCSILKILDYLSFKTNCDVEATTLTDWPYRKVFLSYCRRMKEACLLLHDKITSDVQH